MRNYSRRVALGNYNISMHDFLGRKCERSCKWAKERCDTRVQWKHISTGALNSQYITRSASLTLSFNHCLRNLICIHHAAVVANFSALTDSAEERCQSPWEYHRRVNGPARTFSRQRYYIKQSKVLESPTKVLLHKFTNYTNSRQITGHRPRVRVRRRMTAHRDGQAKHWVKFIRLVVPENQFHAETYANKSCTYCELCLLHGFNNCVHRCCCFVQ